MSWHYYLRIISSTSWAYSSLVNSDLKCCFDASLSSILPGPWSLPAILDFYGGFRWQLVPRLPFPVPRSPLPVPRFSNILLEVLKSSKYISRILKLLEHFYFYILYTCVECDKDVMSYFASSSSYCEPSRKKLTIFFMSRLLNQLIYRYLTFPWLYFFFSPSPLQCWVLRLFAYGWYSWIRAQRDRRLH